MTKTPPKRPPSTPAKKEFVPKTVIMFSTQRAKELAAQINEIRKEHPDLLNGPLGELLDLIK
jgi:hypothetical protein